MTWGVSGHLVDHYPKGVPMAFIPAVIVFAAVFLFFSKEVLTTKEQPQKKIKTEGSEPSMSDILLKYKILSELEKPQG